MKSISTEITASETLLQVTTRIKRKSERGLTALSDLKLFSYMVPGIVAGIYLSIYAIGIVDRGYIRKAMLGISFLAAIVVII